MTDFLAELEALKVKERPDGLHDIQDSVKKGKERINDNEQDCDRVLLHIL